MRSRIIADAISGMTGMRDESRKAKGQRIKGEKKRAICSPPAHLPFEDIGAAVRRKSHPLCSPQKEDRFGGIRKDFGRAKTHGSAEQERTQCGTTTEWGKEKGFRIIADAISGMTEKNSPRIGGKKNYPPSSPQTIFHFVQGMV